MPADVALFREWLNRFTVGPLEPGDDRYVPLHESGRGAVDTIFSTIDLRNDQPTAQLLSGPRGSGKTTELYRLRKKLEEAGFTAVVVDMLTYVSQSSPIDAVEFLIALGVAFGEQLLPEPAQEDRGFASRFRSFLQRVKVSIDIGPASLAASQEQLGASVPGLSVEIDLKKELKSSQPFVDLLRSRLAFQLGDLYSEVAQFCQEVVAERLDMRPDSRGFVLIVDSLEKLRDTSSVRDLFLRDSDKLQFGSHHVVYTVPPMLQFAAPGALPYDGPVRAVPIPHVRDQHGRPHEPGIAQMSEVVARRIPWPQLLGDEAALRTVVLASGGHLRDLSRIVSEIITSAYGRGLDLPVDAGHVDDAINVVGRGFSGISHEDAECLRRVDAGQGHPEFGSSETDRLAGLLDTHMLLAHQNGDPWYAVHPLARHSLGLT